MVLPIVDELDDRVARIDAVHVHVLAAASVERLRDRDVVDRFPVAVMQIERRPVDRQARCYPQLVSFDPQTQQGFHEQPVHPSSGPANTGFSRAPPTCKSASSAIVGYADECYRGYSMTPVRLLESILKVVRRRDATRAHSLTT